MRVIQRVAISYTFPEQFGKAKITYCFPVGRLVRLHGGMILPVEKLRVGMQFIMRGGPIATVTKTKKPKWYGPPDKVPIGGEGNLYDRRVLGTVEHVGNCVIDLTIDGEIITTTPAHFIWSQSQNAYVPAGSLRVGELFHTRNGGTARLEAISRPRYGLVKLYNFEVEEFHNYFVGKVGIQVHNGLPGSCGVPLPEEVTEAEAEMMAADRLSLVTPREAGIVSLAGPPSFPAKRN